MTGKLILILLFDFENFMGTKVKNIVLPLSNVVQMYAAISQEPLEKLM